MHLENNPLKDKGWAKLVWKTGMLGLNTLYYPLVPGQTLPNNCYLCEGGRNSNTVEGRHAPMPSRHIAQPTRPFSAQHCSCSASARSHSPIPSKGEEKAVSKEVSVIQEAHRYVWWGSGFKGRSSHVWHPVLSDQDPVYRKKEPKESRGSRHDPGAVSRHPLAQGTV